MTSPRSDGAAIAERRIAELRALLTAQQAKTEEANSRVGRGLWFLLWHEPCMNPQERWCDAACMHLISLLCLALLLAPGTAVVLTTLLCCLQVEEAKAALDAKAAEVEELKQRMGQGLSEAQVTRSLSFTTV